MKLPSIAEQHASRCVHFTGTLDDTCAAGVRYEDVRDRTVRPFALPCLVRRGDDWRDAATACSKRCLPTPQETAAHVAEVEAWIAEIEAKERRGECNECSRPIARAEQDGPCIYALPCGHRIGQGVAADYNRLLFTS